MSVQSEAALALVEEIRALRQKIPNIVVIPAIRGERQQLAGAASVPADFVENTPVLAGKGTIVPAEAREQMEFAEAFGPVADEVEALMNFIRHLVTAARNKAGNDALTTYAHAKRLARRPEHADLVPHVADMRRALGPKGRRKTKAKAEQPTPPVSPATPATPPVTTSPKP
jgi:hypothetical protein